MDMEKLLEKKVNGKLKKVKAKKVSNEQDLKDKNYYKNKNISFNKRHTRITTYIRKDLNNQLREIKKLGKVKSITAFINAAIINQLKKY